MKGPATPPVSSHVLVVACRIAQVVVLLCAALGVLVGLWWMANDGRPRLLGAVVVAGSIASASMAMVAIIYVSWRATTTRG